MFVSTLFVQALLTVATFATPTANEHLKKRITPSEVDALELPPVHLPQVDRADVSPLVDTEEAAGVALVSVPVSVWLHITVKKFERRVVARRAAMWE